MNTTDKILNLFYDTTGVCTDTRKIEKDCLFICLKGDNFNGNTFALKALEQGAKYVIVDENEFNVADNIFVVDNSLKFLQDLAKHHRNKFSIPVIGITGSNGKTSSKELIKAVLSKKYKVLATQGNLNNHIGVPLTLLKITKEHDIAIIEMGANKYKDIEELCEITTPNFGIITNIGKAHLEGFKNYEGVLKTKLELYTSIKKINGDIIINGDDQSLLHNVPADIKTFSYSQGNNSDIIGKLINLSPFVEMEWSTKNYQSGLISTQMIGKYNFYNFLAAIAFGVRFGVSPEEINTAISEYLPSNNRSQVKETSRNTLILDCYNANPTSMQSALESFAMINHPKKLFIIGDMLELGSESEQEHKNILNLATKLNLFGYVIGPIFSKIAEKDFTYFPSTSEATDFLNKNKVSDSLILLKGSRGIGLEKLENLF
jgi:UDP-N-acetylmuramoyl-tripeptide--D-alanyl-D-alanine ligase